VGRRYARENGEGMDGYVLQSTSQHLNNSRRGTVEHAVRGIMGSGGEFTSTTGRLRKGVSLFEGDTVRRDIRTGGANYWYTRIRKDDGKANEFFFDIRELARQDGVTYAGDEYGAIAEFHKRQSMITKYKQIEMRSKDNETNFKEGFSFDQLDFIRLRPEELEGLLKAFADLGITHTPDGRPIEKIITTTNKPPPKRYRKGYVEPAVNNH
jgi:hypothetical protein